LVGGVDVCLYDGLPAPTVIERQRTASILLVVVLVAALMYWCVDIANRTLGTVVAHGE